MINTDEYGFQYYESLPEGARLCKNIWAFITITPEVSEHYIVNLGMKYLLQSQNGRRYYINEITEHSKDMNLIQYINSKQLFLLS